MTKFKVGDLVKAKRSANVPYSFTTTYMQKAIVENIEEHEEYRQMDIKILGHSKFRICIGNIYKVYCEHFTKITPKPKVKELVGKKAIPKGLVGKKSMPKRRKIVPKRLPGEWERGELMGR